MSLTALRRKNLTCSWHLLCKTKSAFLFHHIYEVPPADFVNNLGIGSLFCSCSFKLQAHAANGEKVRDSSQRGKRGKAFPTNSICCRTVTGLKQRCISLLGLLQWVPPPCNLGYPLLQVFVLEAQGQGVTTASCRPRERSTGFALRPGLSCGWNLQGSW